MGPISLNEIQHEFENGHLSSNDPICEVGAEEWSSVGQILNLGVSDEVRPKFASDEESEPEQRVLERFWRKAQYDPDRIACAYFLLFA